MRQVEAENSNIIGIICSIVVASLVIGVIILDIPSSFTGHYFMRHSLLTTVILDIPSLYWTFLSHSLDIPLSDIHCSPLCHTGHSFIILDIPSSFTGHSSMRHSLLITLSYWTFLHYTGHSFVIHWTFLYETFITHHSVILDIHSLYWTFLQWNVLYNSFAATFVVTSSLIPTYMGFGDNVITAPINGVAGLWLGMCRSFNFVNV